MSIIIYTCFIDLLLIIWIMFLQGSLISHNYIQNIFIHTSWLEVLVWNCSFNLAGRARNGWNWPGELRWGAWILILSVHEVTSTCSWVHMHCSWSVQTSMNVAFQNHCSALSTNFIFLDKSWLYYRYLYAKWVVGTKIATIISLIIWCDTLLISIYIRVTKFPHLMHCCPLVFAIYCCSVSGPKSMH